MSDVMRVEIARPAASSAALLIRTPVERRSIAVESDRALFVILDCARSALIFELMTVIGILRCLPLTIISNCRASFFINKNNALAMLPHPLLESVVILSTFFGLIGAPIRRRSDGRSGGRHPILQGPCRNWLHKRRRPPHCCGGLHLRLASRRDQLIERVTSGAKAPSAAAGWPGPTSRSLPAG